MESLIELVKKLKTEGYHVTIETNGTNYNPELNELVDLMSISPKLSSSTPWEKNLKNTGLVYNQKWAEKHEKSRINYEVLRDNIKTSKFYGKDFQLKFVISSIKDIEEIEYILKNLLWIGPRDVCLMPEGVTVEDLQTKSKWVAEEAIKRGWRFTPRLHVLLFGKNRYV
jgi:7-carboxy-7-deazaguanine synthase